MNAEISPESPCIVPVSKAVKACETVTSGGRAYSSVRTLQRLQRAKADEHSKTIHTKGSLGQRLLPQHSDITQTITQGCWHLVDSVRFEPNAWKSVTLCRNLKIRDGKFQSELHSCFWSYCAIVNECTGLAQDRIWKTLKITCPFIIRPHTNSNILVLFSLPPSQKKKSPNKYTETVWVNISVKHFTAKTNITYQRNIPSQQFSV